MTKYLRHTAYVTLCHTEVRYAEVRYAEVRHAASSQENLAQCRGVRCRHFHLNMCIGEQAPAICSIYLCMVKAPPQPQICRDLQKTLAKSRNPM